MGSQEVRFGCRDANVTFQSAGGIPSEYAYNQLQRVVYFKL